MDGEHRRHKRAAPQAPGHLPQHQKQQHRRGGVQQDIDQMMSAGVQPEELAVQHVGKRGERNPVGDLRVGKGPAHRLHGQSLFHHRVLIHILVVIIIDELKMRRLSEDGQNHQHQKNANRPCLGFADGCGAHGAWF